MAFDFFHLFFLRQKVAKNYQTEGKWQKSMKKAYFDQCRSARHPFTGQNIQHLMDWWMGVMKVNSWPNYDSFFAKSVEIMLLKNGV